MKLDRIRRGEQVPLHGLAIGVELRDFASGERINQPIEIYVGPDDRRGVPPQPVRCLGGVFSLPMRPAQPKQLSLRVHDPDRRYVGRHLLIPLPSPSAAEPELPVRVRRPALFPGASYPVSAGATYLRGAIRTARGPLAYCRVVAYGGKEGTGEPVAWAHGDDRGEFLLILGARAAILGIQGGVRLHLRIFAPTTPVTDPPPEVLSAPDPRTADPASWSKPEEASYGRVFQPGAEEPVAAGKDLSNHTEIHREEMVFRAGRLHTRSFSVNVNT